MPRLLRLIVACAVLSALALASAASATAAGWLAPIEALNGSGAQVTTPRVAVDDAGNVYATWIEGSFLEVSKRPVGGVWETPQTIDSSAGPPSEPDIGVDGAGNAVLVWRTGPGMNPSAIFQSLRAASATSFSAGVKLSAPGDLSVGRPRVAVNRAGRAAIAFRDNVGPAGEAVAAAIGSASAGFSTSELKSYVEGGSTPASDPEAAINEAGDAAAIWRHNESTSYLIHAAYASSGGSFNADGGPELVASSSTATQNAPQVALDAQGRALAVWIEGAAVNGPIKGAVRPEIPPNQWTRLPNTIETGTGAEPQVVFASAGTAVAAWKGDGAMRGSVLPAGGSDFAQPPQQFADHTESPFDIRLDANPAGFSVLVWSGGSTSVARAIVRPDGGVFGPITTLSPAGHGADSTRVAVDPQGNAAAVWVDSNPPGKSPKIVTAEYDATRPKFTGAPSVPDSAQLGRAVSFSALATDDWWEPTLAWDFGDGGSATGGLVTHTYAIPGPHVVTVTATDGVGNSVAFTKQVTVAAAVPVATPTEGKDFNASKVSGTVFVSVPKGKGAGRVLARRPVRGAAITPVISPPSGYTQFRPLGKNDNIPIGSILDATRGITQISMAANKSGTKLQKGKFSKGVFRTKQTTHSPLTSAEMMGGGNFRRDCRAQSGKVSAARRRPHRQLFAHVKGRFRTRGRHSTATVRGTKYLVKDSCRGTLTLVTQGRVVVRDFRKHRTVIVRSGHRYLAAQ